MAECLEALRLAAFLDSALEAMLKRTEKMGRTLEGLIELRRAIVRAEGDPILQALLTNVVKWLAGSRTLAAL